MTYCNIDCNLKDACKRHVNKSQFKNYACEDLSNDTEFCMIAKAKSKMGVKDYNTRKFN